MASDQPTLPRNAFTLQNLVHQLPSRGVLKGGCRTALATLALAQGKNDSCWIGNPELRARIGCTENPLTGHIQDLTHMGFITRRSVGGRVYTSVIEDRCRWWAEVSADDAELKKLLESVRLMRARRNGKGKRTSPIPVDAVDAVTVVKPVPPAPPARRKLVFEEDEPAPAIKRQRIRIELEDGHQCDEYDDEDGRHPWDEYVGGFLRPLNNGDPDPNDSYWASRNEHPDADLYEVAKQGAMRLAYAKGYEVVVVKHYHSGEFVGEDFPEPQFLTTLEAAA